MHFKSTLQQYNTTTQLITITLIAKNKNNFKILKKVFTNNKSCDTIKSQTKKKQKRKGELNMLNQIVVVGRLVSDPEINETENGKKVSEITLAVPRNYKNSYGIYDTDVIPCIVLNRLAENTEEFCKKGDIVGVKGRLQRLEGNTLQVVAEKVTFLSSKKED